jgi:hypothetical protein
MPAPAPPSGDSRRGIDEPIAALSQDLLGRAPFARAITRQIAAAPTGAGAVLAVLGAWGDGKTSVLNMVGDHLAELDERAITIQFNPWLFDTSEQLALRFLEELRIALAEGGTVLDRARRHADQALQDYGGLLGPVGAAESQRRANRTAYDIRDLAASALIALGRRVVIFVDDIDRLNNAEIREVMRLVKLVADFPQTVFVLAFDRERVQAALGERFGVGLEDCQREGRAYLEKIVQITAELPAIARPRLLELFVLDLTDVLVRLGRTAPEGVRWRSVLTAVIGPLLRNLRDVRRYLGSVVITLELIEDELDLADVLALEALRILAPDLHALLPDLASPLTTTVEPVLDPEFDQRAREALERALEEAGTHRVVLEALLRLLFPASGRPLHGTAVDPDGVREWRRTGRVAVLPNLLYYVARSHAPDAVANADVRAVLAALDDRERLDELLSRFDGPRLGGLLGRLRDYADELAPEHAYAAPGAFLAVADRLAPARPDQMGFDEQAQLMGFVGAVLALAPAARLPALLRELHREAPTLSARWLLLAGTGTAPEHNGPLPLIDQGLHDEFDAALTERLHASDARVLRDEQHLPRLVAVLARDDRGREHLRSVGEDDGLLLALLDAAVTSTFDHQHQLSLPWAALTDAFGELWLARRIGELETRGHAGRRPTGAVDVARHYLDHGGPLPLRPG